MKNPTYRTRGLKKAIAAVGVGGQVAFETDSHARVEGFISELHIYEEVPYLIMLARPFKSVRVDLKNIKRIL